MHVFGGKEERNQLKPANLDLKAIANRLVVNSINAIVSDVDLITTMLMIKIAQLQK